MKLTHEDHDQLTVMSIRGEIMEEDIDTLRKLTLERMDNRARDFVIDLEQTDFIDSKGLETLLWLQEETLAQLGQVRLAACQESVNKILEITRLASRFECHCDVESAVKSLR